MTSAISRFLERMDVEYLDKLDIGHLCVVAIIMLTCAIFTAFCERRRKNRNKGRVIL
jgi:hypothetical protein